MVKKNKAYQEHIVSTDKHQVWLHRTNPVNVDKLLKSGLVYGGDLNSNATLQSPDYEEAEKSYRSGRSFGDAVLVMKLPRKHTDTHEKRKGGEGVDGYTTDKNISYWHPKIKGFAIQRQHVHGWIDRETDEYHPNPYLDKPQNLTDEHFPKRFYGGLEREADEPVSPPIIKEEISPKKSKGKKGSLPPPPVYDPRSVVP